MSSVKIYFVLYIMILCELFLVIMARDEAQEAWVRFIQGQFTKLEFSNVKDDIFFINQAVRNKEGIWMRSTWQYNLYPKGFISQQERDSTSVCVAIDTAIFTNKSQLSWDKKILVVNKYKPIDSIYDRISNTKIRLLWDSTGLIYKILIDLNTSDQHKFLLHEAIGKKDEINHVILPLRAYFTTTGSLPFQNKDEEIKNIIIKSIKNSDNRNMFKRVIENEKETSDILQIKIKPGFAGVDPGAGNKFNW